MIDFLSRPEWINPQMDFLLYLQNIRINCPQIIDKFFLSITILGEIWLPTLICAIVYWCIDFKAGMYLFSLEGFNKLFAYLFKMIGCVYRPWILDSRIHPSELAIPYATGYSFPSGHSAMSSSVLGGCAYLLRKHKILCSFLILLILLVGFSRLWLGVHAPQDVVVGLTIGLVLVFLMNPIINWAEKDKNRYLLLLAIINISAALALVYFYFFSTYRIDYVMGKILVDPQILKYDTLVVYGYSLGLINGCFLCARFSPFNPKETPVKQRIIRGIIGSVFTFLILKYAFKYVMLTQLKTQYALTITFFMGIIITFVYPVIFTRFKKLKI